MSCSTFNEFFNKVDRYRNMDEEASNKTYHELEPLSVWELDHVNPYPGLENAIDMRCFPASEDLVKSLGSKDGILTSSHCQRRSSIVASFHGGTDYVGHTCCYFSGGDCRRKRRPRVPKDNGFLGAAFEDFPDSDLMGVSDPSMFDDVTVGADVLDKDLASYYERALKHQGILKANDEVVISKKKPTFHYGTRKAKRLISVSGVKKSFSVNREESQPYTLEDPFAGYDPLVHCGVHDEATNGPCMGSLSCCKKGHNLLMKKLVPRPENLQDLKRKQRELLLSDNLISGSRSPRDIKKKGRPKKTDCEIIKNRMARYNVYYDWESEEGMDDMLFV